jgi:AcrR family transcriptional regulator
MGRPRQVTDEEILGVARRCALEHGPGVSLDVVAQGLGVSGPALLKRFKSRNAMLLAALRPSDEPPWVRALADGPDGRPLKRQLAEVFGRVLHDAAAEMPCLMVLRESGIPFEALYAKGTTPAPMRALRALTSWLGRGRARGLLSARELESAAAAMLGALQGRVFLPHVCRRSFWQNSDRRFVEELAAVFTRALTARSRATASRARVRRSGPAAPRIQRVNRSTRGAR